jgi:P-type Cu+ transporter
MSTCSTTGAGSGCGCAGEPRVPDARDAPEASAARRAASQAMAAAGAVFGAVLLVVVVGEWLGVIEAATPLVPLPVGAALVALVGWPSFRGVVRAALAGRVTSHTLMTVGVLAAFAVGQWITAAVVAFFMRVGTHVERLTVRRSRRALRDLETLAPLTARVERDGVQSEVAVAALTAGDVVVVRPGERIPVDGTVLDGRAAIEQAAITGEAMPAEVEPGSAVYAATLVRGGALRVRAERLGDDALFGRILGMVERAEASRAPIQSFADRFTAWYLPAVALIALLTFIIRRDPLATAAVLVVACSCAFAIATPVAMLASMGAGARRGLLVKGGAALEALARADVVLVDKTGTCTEGRPTVSDIVALDGVTPTEVLRLAASAEQDSEHPLAGAIRREAHARGLQAARPAAFVVHEGSGVAADVDGVRIEVGSERFVAATGAAAVAARPPAVAPAAAGGSSVDWRKPGDGLPADVRRLQRDGASLVFVRRDGELIGAIALRDRVRDDAAAALRELRRLGVTHIEMLTGDHAHAAAPIAAALGVACRAGLLPDDKIRIVREHQEQGRVVVMIGDGVNDAPALAQADVGIALGALRTDLAMESADVALMRDDWALVPEAFRTARRTMRVVRGNFALTGAYNLVGLSLAALGLLPPVAAAAAQSIPDLGILGNSARLFRR